MGKIAPDPNELDKLSLPFLGTCRDGAPRGGEGDIHAACLRYLAGLLERRLSSPPAALCRPHLLCRVREDKGIIAFLAYLAMPGGTELLKAGSMPLVAATSEAIIVHRLRPSQLWRSIARARIFIALARISGFGPREEDRSSSRVYRRPPDSQVHPPAAAPQAPKPDISIALAQISIFDFGHTRCTEEPRIIVIWNVQYSSRTC
ncbi:hypothetical protein C8R44DRAFT_31352 [Mycena epipterygia]|nr:hypothetical protein C8R44DRAFT_31352 [Mycena epipterygia]